VKGRGVAPINFETYSDSTSTPWTQKIVSEILCATKSYGGSIAIPIYEHNMLVWYVGKQAGNLLGYNTPFRIILYEKWLDIVLVVYTKMQHLFSLSSPRPERGSGEWTGVWWRCIATTTVHI
jgi:hypothetical protein